MNAPPVRKMSNDEKVEQCLTAKMFEYQQKTGKEYKKSSLAKERCIIKKMIEEKNLSWEYQKNLMYFMKEVDLEALQKNKSLELQVKRLEDQYEQQKIVNHVERINMRDTAEKQLREKIKQEYSTESMKRLEQENYALKGQLMEFRSHFQNIQQQRDERTTDEMASRSQQIAELTLQNNELKKTQSHGHAKKCKKCRNLKKEILKLKSKLLDYESSDDEMDSSSGNDSS